MDNKIKNLKFQLCRIDFKEDIPFVISMRLDKLEPVYFKLNKSDDVIFINSELKQVILLTEFEEITYDKFIVNYKNVSEEIYNTINKCMTYILTLIIKNRSVL